MPKIIYDFLENAWVDQEGNIYQVPSNVPVDMKLYYLPEHLQQYAEPIQETRMKISVGLKRRTRDTFMLQGYKTNYLNS